MKVLLRDYLGSLKEREELDAVLPDLLSELGYTVFSRPGRGTAQRGVDIGAVGVDPADGERKVFLFSVKQGDLTRQDWDGTPQAMRSSLNEIRDSYIPTRLPARFKELKIVICLCFGGDVQEQVRDLLKGYIAENASDRISFDEWNGDHLAGLLLEGVLREELLPKAMRSSFQKAVAMVDQPEVAFEHFAKLAKQLRQAGVASPRARVRAARQLNICVWILFVWARDAGNVEAAYRVSELALLNVWDMTKPTIGKSTRTAKDMNRVLDELIKLHLRVVGELVETKLLPYAGVPHGLSMSMHSHSALDVNLALFDILGRISMAGLWVHWMKERAPREAAEHAEAAVMRFAQSGLDLIENNPGLMLPVSDDQAIEISLFLQLWASTGGADGARVARWLEEMVNRLNFTIRRRSRYTTVFSDYGDLVDHPRDSTDAYFQEATAGSTLIPILVAWLSALGVTRALESLSTLTNERLEHCTQQLWTPGPDSEAHLYLNDAPHGRALMNLPIESSGQKLVSVVADMVENDSDFNELSAVRIGVWPVVLMACRHHRLPVPPAFWIRALVRPKAA